MDSELELENVEEHDDGLANWVILFVATGVLTSALVWGFVEFVASVFDLLTGGSLNQ